MGISMPNSFSNAWTSFLLSGGYRVFSQASGGYMGRFSYKDCTSGLGFFNTLVLKSIN